MKNIDNIYMEIYLGKLDINWGFIRDHRAEVRMLIKLSCLIGNRANKELQ